MPTGATGTCPHCDRSVGVQVDDSIAMMAGSAIERQMQKQGNAVLCSHCKEWVQPGDMSLDN